MLSQTAIDFIRLSRVRIPPSPPGFSRTLRDSDPAYFFGFFGLSAHWVLWQTPSQQYSEQLEHLMLRLLSTLFTHFTFLASATAVTLWLFEATLPDRVATPAFTSILMSFSSFSFASWNGVL